MFFDPLWLLFMIPGMLLALYAQAKVRGTFGKYSEVRNMYGLSGAQAARRVLDAAGLTHIAIEEIPGELSDHYDPIHKVLRLSPEVGRVPSVAALGVACHEAGHALQDATNYLPMRARAGLVPVANIGSNLGPWLAIIGFMVQSTQLAWLGVLLFSAAVLFALVTLPVEFDASNRALKMLQAHGLVSTMELDGARSVLNAAALTYVAGLVTAILQLLYFVLRASGMGRSEE